MWKNSSAICLQAPGGGLQSKQISSANVHPVALFSVLDHYLRRAQDGDKVIGALLGSRVNDTIEIKTSFAVPYRESAEQVNVDFDYLKSMFDLHQKVNSKEIIVGWYSTGTTLTSDSALLQNFFSEQTAPFQAVHLIVNTGLQKGDDLGIKAYVGSPMGVTARTENCLFAPIPVELQFRNIERSGLDLLFSSTKSSDNTAKLSKELEIMQQTIESVIEMIDRVLGYVQAVLNGDIEGNQKVGKYLLDTLAETSTNIGVESEQLDASFNSHLQDTLMVSYLANLVRAQVEVSARMALVS